MITKSMKEQLDQISKSPTWDGNLISKSDRDSLFKLKLIDRGYGYNFLTIDGVKMCLDLKFFNP